MINISHPGWLLVSAGYFALCAAGCFFRAGARLEAEAGGVWWRIIIGAMCLAFAVDYGVAFGSKP